MQEDRKRYLLERLVAELCEEREIEAPAEASPDELWTAFRALVNTRPPAPASIRLLYR